MTRYVTLAVFLAVVAIVAGAASQFMPGPWYAALAKPSWTPPNWIFGPVWTVLYVMIAVAGWLIWRSRAGVAALGLWIAQLVLNGAWSPVMFGLHRIGWALVVIVLMWTAIVALVIRAWHPARTAALLLLPYLAWVSFATALNLAIWRLNP